MATSQGPQWDLATLPRDGAAVHVLEMLQLSRECLHNATLAEGLAEVPRELRADFKDRSNRGAVFIAGRPRDLGNYTYSLLWHCIVRWARRDPATPASIHDALFLLQNRYASLAAAAPQTDDAMELQGDVIEAVLELARCTGPAVPRAVAVDRMAFSQLVVRFAKAFDRLQHSLCPEYVVCRRRPNAKDLRDLIFLAAGAHSQNSTTSADCLQAFQTAVDRVQPADR